MFNKEVGRRVVVEGGAGDVEGLASRASEYNRGAYIVIGLTKKRVSGVTVTI